MLSGLGRGVGLGNRSTSAQTLPTKHGVGPPAAAWEAFPEDILVWLQTAT